jgi:hypothetical protein
MVYDQAHSYARDKFEAVLHKFNCTRQLHESLSSVAGVQVRGRIPQRIGFVKN